MTDAPEKIWAAPCIQNGWAEANAGDRPSPLNPGDTPYTRTDVAEAAIAERDAVIEGLVEALEACAGFADSNRMVNGVNISAALSRAKGEG